jgi:hypothetical protein
MTAEMGTIRGHGQLLLRKPEIPSADLRRTADGARLIADRIPPEQAIELRQYIIEQHDRLKK